MEAKNIQCPICNGVAYDTQISYLSNPPQYGFLCERCKEMTYLDKYPNDSFLSQTKSNSMEWISVKDRLPEFNHSVIVFCKLWGCYMAYYEQISDTKWGQWKDFNSNINIPPTHWMPLPQSPKQ